MSLACEGSVRDHHRVVAAVVALGGYCFLDCLDAHWFAPPFRLYGRALRVLDDDEVSSVVAAVLCDVDGVPEALEERAEERLESSAIHAVYVGDAGPRQAPQLVESE